jgi:broad specificity phosphatase PhoE
MKISFSFISLCIILLTLGSGCKGLKKSDDGGLLRYTSNDNLKTANISDFIDNDKTTIICVRHAEKQLGTKNPSLTLAGQQRAQDLSDLFTNIKVDAIYSSDYNRTVETAQILSNQTRLPIQRYNPRELGELKNRILNNHQNEVVLVVGHSNSTPTFVNKLLSEDKYSSFDESDYDNIFIVTVDSAGGIESVLLEYGAESAAVSY